MSATHQVVDGAASETGFVRAFDRRDIPSVCDLFLKTFRSGKKRRRDDLARSIEATYLTSPAYRPETGSVVHVDARGRVDGFFGVINITLRFGDRLLRAGVLSAFMADDPEANPMIGLGLVRRIIALPLDVVFADTANRTSLDMSRALHFTVLPLQSLEWVRVLKPVGTGAYWLGKRVPGIAKWAGPLTAPFDAVLRGLPWFKADPRGIETCLDRPIEMADFVGGAPRFLDVQALRPAWDGAELSWLLMEASRQTVAGPLHIREVLEPGGRRAGLYLLYARKGGIAHVLHVLARPGREEKVIGSLIRQAALLGAVAVRGPASPEATRGLIRQPGIIYHHVMSTVARATDPEVGKALRTGNVQLGGLAGETWARIFADQFS